MPVPVAPSHAVKCLKAEGGHEVWLMQPPGSSLRTLKIWPLTPWMRFKLLLGIAQPQRQIKGLRRLQKLGVLTPSSYGSWQINTHYGQQRLQLELEYAHGQSAWEMISTDAVTSAAEEATLIKAAQQLGAVVAQLAAANILHRDLKPSNVVINSDHPDDVKLWLIDTVGVRPIRSRLTATERMLERLAIQPIGLNPSLAQRLRTSVVRMALEPLSASDRRTVLRLLRKRLNKTFK